MWLIRTEDQRLEEFVPEQCPPYAILSHRWEDDEVTFNDMKRVFSARSKKGFKKISHTCELARKASLKYAWIDTCCINRDSSAELSESINSMFQWYKQAKVCYAYLYDLLDDNHENLGKSEWFSRGWTLQELIAPKDLRFYSSSWKLIGNKLQLLYMLNEITDIDADVLSGDTNLSDIVVATKMAWAAKRTTTRLEDTAYCLLGIFNVNMPLLYGEGQTAFHRLQEEIIRRSDDPSIFAWRQPDAGYTGLLARSPAQFAHIRGPAMIDLRNDLFAHHIVVTNKGIQATVYALLRTANIYVIDTHCHDTKTGHHLQIFLFRPSRSQHAEYNCTRIHVPTFTSPVPALPFNVPVRNAWYDIPNIDTIRATFDEGNIPMSIVVSSHSYGAKSLARAGQCLGLKLKLALQTYPKPLFNQAVRYDGKTFPVSTELTASLPPFRYGILWKLIADHSSLEYFAFGIDFDCRPFLIAAKHMDSSDVRGKERRRQTIRNIITCNPSEDPEWFLADMQRSKKLTEQIWRKVNHDLPLLYPEQARTEWDQRILPSKDGLWAFTPQDVEYVALKMPDDDWTIRCDFQRSYLNNVTFEIGLKAYGSIR